MEWNISHDSDNNILVVRTEGILDIASADIMREEGSKLIKEHAYTRCLLDHRKIKADRLGTLDIYQIPKKYHDLGIPKNFKMALLVTSEIYDNLKFYETVCVNNGYFVSLFFDEESALQWLTG